MINEYLNDCEVISRGKRALVPPLDALETIDINGVQLEAFTTSGGLGTMCDTWDGKVETLDYKTMRYPGQCEKMSSFLQEQRKMHVSIEEAAQILTAACPPVSEDVVFTHVAVEGQIDGEMRREERSGEFGPIKVGDIEWRAISWTTACSVAAVVEMVSSGALPARGFIKQEEIPLDEYLATANGGLYLS